MSDAHSIQTLLVVDDQPDNLQFLEQLLGDSPVTLLQAKSGESALQLMAETIPAAVILDADMPGMDGYQVINAMQANPALQHIPVLLMTPHLAGQKQNLHHSLLYVVDCLSKPIDPQTLLAKLKIYLAIDRYRVLIKNVSQSNDQLLETMEEGVLGIDVEGHIRFANASAARLLKIPVTQLVDVYVESLFSEPCRFVESRWTKHPITKACQQNTLLQIERAQLWCADGSTITVRFAVLPAGGGLSDIRWVLAFRELQKPREREKSLSHLNRIDYLTQLPTRVRFVESLEQAIEQAKKRSKKLAILHINLDHFRNINESLGYDMGDRLLQSVGKRLRDRFRKQDPMARLDGDQFTILLSEIEHPAFAGMAADKVLDCLKEPFLLNGHELFVSASIGVAIYPSCGGDVLSLMKNADIAAERAKLLGRSSYQYFTADMNKMIVERMMLLQDLHHAIDRGQLMARITPIFDLQTESLCAQQAQLIWQHPKRGTLAFAQFANDAENSGLLLPISRWMMTEALGRLSQLKNQTSRVILTVHPSHLMAPGFMHFLQQQLTQFGLEPKQLIIELSETIALNRKQDCQTLLVELHQLGIELALADFGRGYGSLELIRKLPIHFLKLSSVWLEQDASSAKDRMVLTHLVALANDLGLKIWLEGVDSPEQLAFAKQLGVHWIQGSAVVV